MGANKPMEETILLKCSSSKATHGSTQLPAGLYCLAQHRYVNFGLWPLIKKKTNLQLLQMRCMSAKTMLASVYLPLMNLRQTSLRQIGSCNAQNISDVLKKPKKKYMP